MTGLDEARTALRRHQGQGAPEAPAAALSAVRLGTAYFARKLNEVSDAARYASSGLPWITEAKTALGRNEARDRTWLMNWLKRDGRSLGDPGKNPWCGDFVETGCCSAREPSRSPARC